MIIPPVKLVEAGTIVPDVFGLILAQIRSKHETAGDFRAQIAANTTGVRRIAALVERHGLARIATTMSELLDYTERRTHAELVLRFRTGLGGPKARSTSTATPTSRFTSRRSSRSGQAGCVSTSPAPIHSGGRR